MTEDWKQDSETTGFSTNAAKTTEQLQVKNESGLGTHTFHKNYLEKKKKQCKPYNSCEFSKEKT